MKYLVLILLLTVSNIIGGVNNGIELNDDVYKIIQKNVILTCDKQDSLLDTNGYINYKCKNKAIKIKRRGRIYAISFVYNHLYYAMQNADTSLSGVSGFKTMLFGCEIIEGSKIKNVRSCLEGAKRVYGIELYDFKSTSPRMSVLAIESDSLYVGVYNNGVDVLLIGFDLD